MTKTPGFGIGNFAHVYLKPRRLCNEPGGVVSNREIRNIQMVISYFSRRIFARIQSSIRASGPVAMTELLGLT